MSHSLYYNIASTYVGKYVYGSNNICFKVCDIAIYTLANFPGYLVSIYGDDNLTNNTYAIQVQISYSEIDKGYRNVLDILAKSVNISESMDKLLESDIYKSLIGENEC